MICVKCKICNHKEYYQTKQNLFNDLKMYSVKNKFVICSDCLNLKGINE